MYKAGVGVYFWTSNTELGEQNSSPALFSLPQTHETLFVHLPHMGVNPMEHSETYLWVDLQRISLDGIQKTHPIMKNPSSSPLRRRGVEMPYIIYLTHPVHSRICASLTGVGVRIAVPVLAEQARLHGVTPFTSLKSSWTADGWRRLKPILQSFPEIAGQQLEPFWECSVQAVGWEMETWTGPS